MVDIQHKNITGADAAHPPFYASESDPTTTLGAYRGWFKPSTGEVKVRDSTNTAWLDVVVTGTPPALTTHLSDASDAHDASAISIVDSGTHFASTHVEGALQELGASDYRTLVTLGSDVSNSTTTYADVTGLSFSVTGGQTYHFDVLIVYDSQATATGSRWSINGPASPTLLGYRSRWPTSATAESMQYANTYDAFTVSATSAFTAGNIAQIKGVIIPSTSGTLIARFASEAPGTNNQITAKAGSTLEWW